VVTSLWSWPTSGHACQARIGVQTRSKPTFQPAPQTSLIAVKSVTIAGTLHAFAGKAQIHPDQIVWNMRSALNVAALDCNQPQHAEIQSGYRTFLRTHAKRLATANRGVDTGFRARFGAGFVRQRESYLTRVYNFYAFPPVLSKFCDATMLVMRDLPPVTSLQLHNFAALTMPKLDQVYEDFYRDYAKYQVDAAAWDARYGVRQATYPAPVTSTTGRAQ